MRTVLSVQLLTAVHVFFSKKKTRLWVDSKSSKISHIKDFRNLTSLRKIILNSRYEFGT